MNDARRRIIKCGTHGDVECAFVCCHLLDDARAPAGFNELAPEPESPDPVAWCDDCIAAWESADEWTDELEQTVDLRTVCEFCYATLRARHERPTGTPAG